MSLMYAVEDHPSDGEEDAHDPDVALKIAGQLKEIGTKLYKAKDYERAVSKCAYRCRRHV